MITHSDVDKALYVIHTSGMADHLAKAMNLHTKGLGRKPKVTAELFVLGALLTAMDGRGFILTEIYKTLTCHLPADTQVRMGIRDAITSSEPRFAQDAIDRFMHKFIDVFEFGTGSAPQLEPEEREHRRAALYQALYSGLDATLIPTTSTYLAIDSTGVWSWGKNPGKVGLAAMNQDIENLRAAGLELDALNQAYYRDRMTEEASASSANKKNRTSGGELQLQGKGHDPDARSSGKTGKDGKTEWYYGHELHAVCRTADPGDTYAGVPNLVVRFEVAPAGRGAVAASQRLIASIPSSENATHIVADRWYSNLTEENWYLPLTDLGLKQVIDMREGDQAWTDVDGMRVTAGWCHCPATPDHLEKIARPFDLDDPDFQAKIAERWQFAAQLKEDTGTRRRFVCPALAGKVRCPARPATMQAGPDLPLVENPPREPGRPKICTQSSVVVHASNPSAKARLWQPHYWGSRGWIAEWKRRTAIEQVFGKRKDRHGTDMSRGFVRVTGLASMTLAIGFILIAGNVRDLEAWVANGNYDGRHPDHPLLQRRSDHVVLHLNHEQAATYQDYLTNQARYEQFRSEQLRFERYLAEKRLDNGSEASSRSVGNDAA